MKKAKLYLLLLVCIIIYSCRGSEGGDTSESAITHEKQEQQRDSLVKSDRERADSMLKAMKEKLKVQ